MTALLTPVDENVNLCERCAEHQRSATPSSLAEILDCCEPCAEKFGEEWAAEMKRTNPHWFRGNP